MSSGPIPPSSLYSFKPALSADEKPCTFPRCACPDPKTTCEHQSLRVSQIRTVERAALRPDPRAIKNAAVRRKRKQRATRASRRKNRGR